MSIILNLSGYNVIGVKFALKGKRLCAGCDSARADELLDLLKLVDGFNAENAVIVPHDNARFWTFFLSAWRKEFGDIGSLALSFSSNGGPIYNLGELTTISSLFG